MGDIMNVPDAFERRVDEIMARTYDVAQARRPVSSKAESLAFAASGLFVTALTDEALSVKGRRTVAPVSRGYIEDVDTMVENANPRSSVDSTEFLKLFERLPNLDTLAYNAARSKRPEVLGHFSQKIRLSPADILHNVTAAIEGIRSESGMATPSVRDFSWSSRFSRTPETNTLEYNIAVLNAHIDAFRHCDYRVLTHDYSSMGPVASLENAKVFSTSNGALNLDDHICTRRTRINGESHFVVKYGENGALPGSRKTEFAYAKLSNRLSLYSNEDGYAENLSVAYNLDPRNLRSLYLRDVDVVFHDLGDVSLEVLISAKKLAEFFDRMDYTGQYAHIYLDELLREDAILGIWLLDKRGDGTITNVIDRTTYRLRSFEAQVAEKSIWHIANLDASKRHYCKIGSKASVTAYSGRALAAEISKVGEMKYGTMIKAIFENEKSGRLETWLQSPRLRELYETHDDALFNDMIKTHGKLHTVGIIIDGKRVPALATSFDFLDVEREKEVALLFSTYFLMMEHKSKLEKLAALPSAKKRVDAAKESLNSPDKPTRIKSALTMLAFSSMPVSLMQFGLESQLYSDDTIKKYSSTERSYREYLDDHLAFNQAQKSKLEATSTKEGVHVLIKGCSYNNNYNEEFFVTNAGDIRRVVPTYRFPSTPFVRALTDPTKMILVNSVRARDTLTLTDIDGIFGTFGPEVQTHSRLFY